MPAKRSEKSVYQSKYGGGWVSRGQILAEIMCERQAKERGETLFVKFWESPKWEKQFKLQLIASARILKKFPYEHVFQVVNGPFGKKVYSLTAKWFIEILKRELPKFKPSVSEDNRQENPIVEIPTDNELPCQLPKQFITKSNNILNKLD